MSTLNKSPEHIKDIFNMISPVYNTMNTLMTFGMHHLWRRNSLKNISRLHQGLDLCTGTGDFAFELKKKCDRVTGVDFSENMLSIAQEKYKDISFVKADALCLPFAENSFDIVTIGFGVRNFSNLEAGLQEALRVLRPGGRLIILESGTPSHMLLKTLSLAISKFLIRSLSVFYAKNTSPYEYLLESTEQFPCAEKFTSILSRIGFNSCSHKAKFFGNVYIYNCVKPS